MNTEALLTGLARVSAQAGVLVPLILVAQWLFRRQLTPRWRAALWVLLMIRLVMPHSPKSATSIHNLVTRWESRPAQGVERLAAPPAQGPAPAPENPRDSLRAFEARGQRAIPGRSVGAPSHPTRGPGEPATPFLLPPPGSATAPVWPVLFWVWLAGVVTLGGRVVSTSVRVARGCRRWREVSEPAALAIAAECAGRLGIRARLAMGESPAVSSPALFGLIRPRLILPAGFISQFQEQELRFVLLHELAHLKRRDLWFNWLVTLLQILHWFNPLVWLGFARWRADRELACDALALEAAGGNQNQEYGRTILSLLERIAHHAPAPGLVGILEDRRELERRIRMIARFRPGRRSGVRAVALLVALAAIGLTDAQTEDPPRPTEVAAGKAASAIAQGYTVRAGGSRSFVGMTNPPASNRATIAFAAWGDDGRPVFRLTNGEPHAILLWNVRVQVRSAGSGTDGLGWDTVYDDYPTGGPGWNSSQYPRGSHGQFEVPYLPTAPWRVCVLYSIDWADRGTSYSGNYEVVSPEMSLASDPFTSDITGRVVLKGIPPPERVIDLSSDRALAARQPKGLTTRHYEASAAGGLRNVLVYVRGAFDGRTFDPPQRSAFLDHVNGLFQPYVMGLRVNQPLNLTCSDGTICSFHSAPLANPGFALAPGRGAVSRTFAQPEVPVRFKCDLHPWNYAYIGVFAHPFFAVTDEDGRFTIRSVPMGHHRLEIFHPGAGTTAKPIRVTAGLNNVDFEVWPGPRLR